MKLPMAKSAAAVLSAMYRDRAKAERDEIIDNEIQTMTVYDGQKCHLMEKCRDFSQTEGNGEVKAGFTVFFPPKCDVKAGDLITVTHRGRVFRGRAGMPVFGEMALKVTINDVWPT